MNIALVPMNNRSHRGHAVEGVARELEKQQAHRDACHGGQPEADCAACATLKKRVQSARRAEAQRRA